MALPAAIGAEIAAMTPGCAVEIEVRLPPRLDSVALRAPATLPGRVLEGPSNASGPLSSAACSLDGLVNAMRLLHDAVAARCELAATPESSYGELLDAAGEALGATQRTAGGFELRHSSPEWRVLARPGEKLLVEGAADLLSVLAEVVRWHMAFFLPGAVQAFDAVEVQLRAARVAAERRSPWAAASRELLEALGARRLRMR